MSQNSSNKGSLDDLKQKIDAYNERSSSMRNTSLDSADYYANRAHDMSGEINYLRGLANALKNKGIVSYLRGDLDLAMKYYDETLERITKDEYKLLYAYVLNNKGMIYDVQGDYQTALDLYGQSLKLHIELGHERGIADVYNNIGIVYYFKGDYNKSIEYILKSVKIEEKIGNTEGVAASYLNIGDILYQMKNSEEAEKYFLKSLELYNETSDINNKMLVLNNLGNLSLDRNQFKEAQDYFSEALKISRKLGINSSIATSLYNIGYLNEKSGNLDEAIKNCEESLLLSRQTDEKQFITRNLKKLGDIYKKKGNYDLAIKHYNEGLGIAEEIEFKVQLVKFHEALAEIQAERKNFHQAYNNIKSYAELKDTIFSQEQQQQISELQTKYETEKSEAEITLQKAQLTAQESIIKQQSLQRNFLIGGAALMVLIFGLSIYTYRNRLKVKELIYRNQEEAEELRSRFFANISHEFRTPLTLISARIDDFMESSGKENQVDLLSMKKNTTRLLQLVNQLLDLSRIDAGKIPLKVSYGNVSQFVKAFTDSFHSLALQRDITLHSQMNDAAIEGYFDPDQMEKIVVNLLSNAFKNTPEGGEIYVSVQLLDSKEILLNVKDTGVGISKEDMAHIFDRFYQSSHSNNSGSGIGLSLTRELVELYRGSIEVESELEKGSSFTVKLPIDRKTMVSLGVELSEKPFTFTENKNYPIEPDTGYHVDKQQLILPEGKPSILVVEDNPELRNYIVDFLSSEYQVMEASNGKFGLEYAIEHQPDMILSDVMMPEMDGIELCKKIKDTVETSHIPFIMLTAKASGEDKLEGLDLGADDYLVKPFDKKELKVRIKNLIIQRKKLIEKFSQSLNPRDIKLNSADERFMTQAWAIVREHLSDELFSVEVFSKAIGMSRTQLFRKIKSLTGMSVSEYMRVIRLNQAAEMLKNKAASVSEIAFDVGFNNLSYFTKCFKERFGVNPSDYN